jgi:hypothetical protein
LRRLGKQEKMDGFGSGFEGKMREFHGFEG